MPLDNRRFNGPEDSVSYLKYTKDYVKPYNEVHAELLDDKQRRKDGRALDEARSMFATTDLLTQAKGSAYIEMKNTKVVCSVFDPREIPGLNEFRSVYLFFKFDEGLPTYKKDILIYKTCPTIIFRAIFLKKSVQLGELYCDVKFAPFSCLGERRSLAPDDEEKALSVALRQALEPSVCRHLFPNYQIDVFVYIIENDGSCLAAAINAAGLALANAAVPMYDIITSCSLAVIENKIFVDPNKDEEAIATSSPETSSNHGIITMSTLSALKQISDFRQVGSMDIECVTNALEILEKECDQILPLIQKILVTNVVTSLEQNKVLEEEAKEREEILNAKVEEWQRLLNAG